MINENYFFKGKKILLYKKKENTRKRAFFIKRPNDPENDEKDKLRLMRADENKYKEIYKHNIKI